MVIKTAFYSVLIIPTLTCGQGSVPENLNELLVSLVVAQEKFHAAGYEIVHSSLFIKKQHWLNEAQEKCMHILWNTNGKGDLESSICFVKYGKNLAPPKKYSPKDYSANRLKFPH